MKDKKLVLVVSEKHGTRYFGPTVEDINLAALGILRERWEAGWYPPAEKALGKLSEPDLSVEIVDQLPSSCAVHVLHREQVERYRNGLRQREVYEKWLAQAAEALANANGELALVLLFRRTAVGYEYEDIDLKTLEDFS